MIRKLLPLVFALAACLCAQPAVAQAYPARPVKIIVGFAPGGATDTVARQLALHLEKSIGQPVLVENRPGGSGTIGANAVARSAPDGYTLHVASVTGVSPVLVKTGAVLPERDLMPVSTLSVSPWLLMVRAELPVRNLAELMAYAKANPGKLNLGASGAVPALAAEVLRSKTGLDFTTIPFKGSGPVTTALLGGEIEGTLDSAPAYLPHLQSGKLRALFIAPTRSPLVPNAASLPLAADAGVTGFDPSFVQGVWAPVGTPADIVQKLSEHIRAVMQRPEVREQFQKAGVDALGSTPEELQRRTAAEISFWSTGAKAAKFEPQ